MSDAPVRFFVGVFVVMNLVLTPLALTLGFAEAPWTQIVLLTPAISALLTGMRHRLPLGEMGMGIGNPAWILAGFAGVAAYALLTVLAGRALGVLEFSAGWDAQAFAMAMVTRGLALESLLWVFGEELGWRGLLSARLTRSGGQRKALFGVWALWFAWHLAPLLAFGATGAEILCFGSLLLALAAFLNTLRQRSGSIWPAVTAHVAHNQLVESLTAEAATPLANVSWSGELGVGTAIMAAMIGVIFHALVGSGADTSESPTETC